MKKHITDAKTGIAYTLHGEYYLPNCSLPAEEELPIGIWGERHKQFIKNHQRGVFNAFLANGKLQQYLAQIDQDAQEMFDLLVRQLAEQ
ncbi:MAG: TnpV protein, partial [Clostridia bacterium]|nr:TnpV protein [Clostridia bacterium]